jgi:hypothetical protein
MQKGDYIIARNGFKAVLGQVNSIKGTKLTITTPTGRTAILDTLKWVIQVIPYIVQLVNLVKKLFTNEERKKERLRRKQKRKEK